MASDDDTVAVPFSEPELQQLRAILWPHLEDDSVAAVHERLGDALDVLDMRRDTAS